MNLAPGIERHFRDLIVPSAIMEANTHAGTEAVEPACLALERVALLSHISH